MGHNCFYMIADMSLCNLRVICRNDLLGKNESSFFFSNSFLYLYSPDIYLLLHFRFENTK